VSPPSRRAQDRAGRPYRSVPRGARGAAYDLLHEVGSQGAYANVVWPRILDDASLDARDSGFATELAYGTLRWQGFYDAVIDTLLDRPRAEIDPRVLDLLRLGCHQILMMRTPAHAAVGEMVTLARSVAGEGPSRLVNAVLRRVADGGDRQAWVARVAPGETTADLAIKWSHPAWIVRALRSALTTHPPDLALTRPPTEDQINDLATEWAPDSVEALLAADNIPARPTLAARPTLLSPESLRAIAQVTPGRWSPWAATLDQGRPDDLAVIRNGRAGIQDEGSQLMALALARAPLDGSDKRWVDLAAGPGGKAALLTGLAIERGALLEAVELHPHRADLVRKALRAYPEGSYVVHTADGREPLSGELADRVLLDAPCTGLGALRRRPEARWRRTAGDLATLGPLQRDLLRSALRGVRKGGVVAYVTCSPHLAETDQVIDDILREFPEVEQQDARPLLPEVPHLGAGPAIRLWPHVHGTDGMFLALLRRRI